jgi:hypothetical protein
MRNDLQAYYMYVVLVIFTIVIYTNKYLPEHGGYMSLKYTLCWARLWFFNRHSLKILADPSNMTIGHKYNYDSYECALSP